MTALLFLVRHAAHAELGQRLTGRSGGGLTAAGERQASALAERLGREPLAAVHTSPRERAKATAEAIARRCGVPVEPSDALDEIDFGDWTGAAFDDLEGDPAWDQWNRSRSTGRPPNGETMEAATDRIVAHIERVAEAHAGAVVALVSHCDMIRGAIAHCLGLPPDHLLRFEIGPASFSRLRVGAWGAQILSMNETAA